MKERRIELPRGHSIRKIIHEGNYLTFEFDTARRYEIVKTGDSISVLIYIKDEDKLIFIKQDRPPMISYENPNGTMLEVPAGRFDYDASVKTLIANEAKEEAGVELSEADIFLLNQGKPLAPSAGALTERRYLAYAEVDSSKVDFSTTNFGIHEEGEFIRRILVPVEVVAKEGFVFDTLSSMVLVEWFLRNRYDPPDNNAEDKHTCNIFFRLLGGCCK